MWAVSAAANTIDEAITTFQSGQFSEALTTLKLPKNADDTRAQFYIGKAYRDGTGVEQSYETAAEWWLKAAAQDDAMSLLGLAMFSRNGTGLP